MAHPVQQDVVQPWSNLDERLFGRLFLDGTSHVHSLSMFVDMHVNILWGKFVKMTYINENLIKHWSLILDFMKYICYSRGKKDTQPPIS